MVWILLELADKGERGARRRIQSCLLRKVREPPALSNRPPTAVIVCEALLVNDVHWHKSDEYQWPIDKVTKVVICMSGIGFQ